ncbi:MAG TPA: pitrilysin family protein [Candidatus Methylacidiphilales bacterium]|jgi:zinc protease|nr:pitrilysin family protein [Candidatus Methylacidiphilales bacterium]
MPSDSHAGLQAKAAGAHPLIPVPTVEVRELSNGLSVLVQPDFTAPVVSIQFWCASGSIHETPWLGAGLSHLLEHLMFKGTPTRGNSQMAQQIQDLGGHLNAYTSFDRTVYHVDLPSDNALTALEILGDAVFNSTIPAEEFDKEMEVIRREFAMGRDNPDSELGKLIFQTAFIRHPYRHPVIGYLDLFNQLTRDDVLAYYRERYAPQNLSLIVCGAVAPETIFARAAELLEKIPRRKMADLYLPHEPRQHQRRELRREFPTQLSRVALCWPMGGFDHADTPALDLLAMLAGGGRSSRLHQSCVEKLALAEQLDAFAYAPADHGLWGIEARCAPDKEQALVAEIGHQILIFQEEAPQLRELDRAKRQSLLHQVHSQKTMSGKAASLGRGWLYQRDPQLSARYHEHVQAVTPEQILAVARRYFHIDRENLVSLVPQSGKPSAAILSREALGRPVPQFVPLGANRNTASRCLYMPQHTLPLLSLRATLPGGLLSEPEGKAGLGRLAANLLVKGTRRRNAEQLAADVEQLGGSLHSDSGNNSATLSLELLSPDWKAGLDLFLEMLAETAPTEAELQTEKRKQLSLLQAENDYPMAAARDLVRAALYPGHPYGGKNLGTVASIESITLKDIAAYQASRLLTQELIFTVTGPTPPGDWRNPATAAIGSLAPRNANPAKKIPLPALSETIRMEQIVPKEQAVMHLAFPTVPVAHPDQVPLSILDEALSDLGSRLFVRIREELGLAYFVGTSQFLGLEAGHFFFYLGTDPAKRGEIEAELLREVAGLARDGITAGEFARARAKMQSQDKLDQQNPSQIAYAASLDELFGLGYAYGQTRRDRIAAITLDEVNATAAKYFSSPHYVLATVSPK